MRIVHSFVSFRYKTAVAGKHLPDLLRASNNNGMGKYGLIIFEDFRYYLDMDPNDKEKIVNYCEKYQVRFGDQY